MREYIKVLLMLLGFIAILYAASLTTKFIGKKYAKLGHSEFIQIIDHLMLGKEKDMYIVQIGKRFFLIGVSNNIEVLAEIEHDDLIAVDAKQENEFSDFFGKYIKKQQGVAEDTNKFGKSMTHFKKDSGEEKDVKKA